jgi:hypothetical protein
MVGVWCVCVCVLLCVLVLAWGCVCVCVCVCVYVCGVFALWGGKERRVLFGVRALERGGIR